MAERKVESRQGKHDWRRFRAAQVADALALGASAAGAIDYARQAEARMRRRLAWLRGLFDSLNEAHDAAAEAYGRIADANPELGEDELDLLPEPEEMKRVEELEALIADVRDHDRWPRHLHFPDR